MILDVSYTAFIFFSVSGTPDVDDPNAIILSGS